LWTNIRTYRNNDDADKTLRKPTDNSPRESGVDVDKTIAIGKNKSTTDASTDAVQGGQMEVYELNGVKYNFKKIISESTGEGQIYLVERKGNVFVLKLYYPQFKPKEELFKILKSFDFPGIIKLHDYGVWTSPMGSTRSFELMEFLEGGTLDEVFFVRDAQKLRDIAVQQLRLWIFVTTI
jgi:serine/threonine protein kinase